MLLNNDLFVRPPAEHPIPNDGVTQVGTPDGESGRQWDVLRYELENFVCEGEYADGLERILGSYLTNQARSTQPAVWVSGFYGSGKSHLVRVLEHVWADTRLPDGASARGLVNLPQGVKDYLRELSGLATRWGSRPWSVAGSLDRGSAGSLNAAFLALVLDAAGFPSKVAPAQVALWLIDEGVYDAVEATVTAAGKNMRDELRTYNLSRPLAEAILTHLPGFAHDAASVRGQLKNQFPDVQAVSIAETMDLTRRVLRRVGGGEVPPTLVVLDEVQQYIGDDGGRALDVQHLVEAVTKEMDNRVLVVATGQQEMTADPTLQRIRDRFTVKVTLKNQDVDAVIRQVLLGKQPQHLSELVTTLDRASAEISREIVDSKIAHRTEDDAVLAADYPLLPARRRFWEHVLRAADAGRAGQLRSQLRIVHDATAEISSRPVGTVIGADFLYDAKNEDLNQTAQLSKNTQRLIKDQGDKDPLRGRVLGLVMLISLLPTSSEGDIGVRATAAHLADLLVEDLQADGARLRAEVPRLLTAMADEGILQEESGEYRLQTEAGRDWTDAFRHQRANVSAHEISARRDELLQKLLDEHLPRRVVQGEAKVGRPVRVHRGDDEPAASDEIHVWVRSEWDGVTPKQFDELARELGQESPTVLVHVPVVARDELKQDLSAWIAAEHVLSQRGQPQDDDGRQARASMESQRNRSRERVEAHARAIIDAVRVLNGGGSVPTGSTLRERLDTAGKNAATRRFPRFGEADSSRWDRAVAKLKAGGGSDAALGLVGHSGDAASHKVVKAVLDRVTGAGTSVTEIEAALTAAPFGWPEDALRTAVCVLVEGGYVQAMLNGAEADVPKIAALTRRGGLYLRRESVVLTTTQKLKARSLLTTVLSAATTDPVTNDNLVPKTAEAIEHLADRAARVSGAAPFPTVTLPKSLADLRNISGNDRVVSLLTVEDDLRSFETSLSGMESRRTQRTGALADARRLAEAAATLPTAKAARERLEAFVQSSALLAETDSITPIVTELTSVVRSAITAAAATLADAHVAALERLEASDAWGSLDDAKRAELLAGVDLGDERVPDVGDTAAVIAAVSARPLPSWQDAIDAVDTRVTRLIAAAEEARAPAPDTTTAPAEAPAPSIRRVRPQRRTLRTSDDVDAYLGELRTMLIDALDSADSVEVIGS